MEKFLRPLHKNWRPSAVPYAKEIKPSLAAVVVTNKIVCSECVDQEGKHAAVEKSEVEKAVKSVEASKREVEGQIEKFRSAGRSQNRAGGSTSIGFIKNPKYSNKFEPSSHHNECVALQG